MNPYFEQMILSASPIELVRLMYQKAIACVADARDHLKAGRVRERSQAIRKTHAILAELLISLDPEKAPEMAKNLRGLYCYMQQRLIDANFQQQDAPLEETSRLLATLAEAWMAVPPELNGNRETDAYEDEPCTVGSGVGANGYLGTESMAAC